MAVNGFPSEAAIKMAQAAEVCRWHEGSRLTLYFAADGRRLVPGGRAVVREAGGVTDGWCPQVFAVAIDYPFCPSVASCADLLTEHTATGDPAVYNEIRWHEDPRVDEQAGPSVTGDWKLEELLQKVAA